VLGSNRNHKAGDRLIKILVVEDEVIVGLALREELQDLGVCVVVTNDAEAAVQQLSLAKFDGAVIDIALPGMRGDVLAKECCRLFPHMPIVLATGMREREIRVQFDRDSRLKVLGKPYEFGSLRACFEEMGLNLQPASVSLSL
jgi:two-component system, OmpR family, KDP operon response regulator KdpE